MSSMLGLQKSGSIQASVWTYSIVLTELYCAAIEIGDGTPTRIPIQNSFREAEQESSPVFKGTAACHGTPVDGAWDSRQ